MKANGYMVVEKKSGKTESKRFEARRPLELAQMDILEFFINKAKVYLILLMDDFSRFILGFRLLDQTSVDAVIRGCRRCCGSLWQNGGDPDRPGFCILFMARDQSF